jgi:hypothetical protein
MLQKIKKNFLKFVALTLLSTIGLTGVVVAQDRPNPQGAICRGADQLQISSNTASEAECENLSEGSTDSVNNLITQIINVFSVIVGIIAVIMIIWGGLKYITSGGDSGNVTGAKNTILYAIIGLIIVALAQFIVRFVLAKTAETAT